MGSAWTIGLLAGGAALAHAQQPPAAAPPPAAPAPAAAAVTAIKFYPDPNRAPVEALQGKPAPELEDLQWVQGGPTTIAAQKGKVVLVVFWSRLCGPCLAALPSVRD